MKWAGRMAFTALVAGAVPAAAETIASPPLFSGAQQNAAVCYLFNAGTTPIRVINFRLWSSAIGKNYISKGDCPKFLPAFGTCQARFAINGSGAFSCSLVLDGAANPNARASVELHRGSTALSRAVLR